MKKNWLIIIISLVIVLLVAGYFLAPLIINQLSDKEAATQKVFNGGIEKPIGTTTNPVPAGNSLDLSGRGLSSIPGDVFNRTNLVELNVSSNVIKGSIQAEIRQLKNLRILRASNNQMTGMPAEIGQLENLELLDLSNNQITGLPLELGNLKKIKTINLSGNNYSKYDLELIRSKFPNTTFILD